MTADEKKKAKETCEKDAKKMYDEKENKCVDKPEEEGFLSKHGGKIAFLLLAGGAAYYFLVYKKQKEAGADAAVPQSMYYF